MIGKSNCVDECKSSTDITICIPYKEQVPVGDTVPVRPFNDPACSPALLRHIEASQGLLPPGFLPLMSPDNVVGSWRASQSPVRETMV